MTDKPYAIRTLPNGDTESISVLTTPMLTQTEMDEALLLRALMAMDRLRFVDSKASADATADEINAVMHDIKIRLKGH